MRQKMLNKVEFTELLLKVLTAETKHIKTERSETRSMHAHNFNKRQQVDSGSVASYDKRYQSGARRMNSESGNSSTGNQEKVSRKRNKGSYGY